MSFDNFFRISAHAVIGNNKNNILLLKQTYTDKHWGLPGGSPEKNESIHDTLIRECHEELGCEIKIKYLSGIYYHEKYNSYAIIYRCELPSDCIIRLSKEHSEYKYFHIDELSEVQRQRVNDCFNFDGEVKSGVFNFPIKI